MDEVESLIVRRIAVEMKKRKPGAHATRLDSFDAPGQHSRLKTKSPVIDGALAQNLLACCDATSISRQLAVLATLLLTRLLLPAMLATLTRILGLLTGLLLPALLTALVRVVLALLLVSHSLRSLLAAPFACAPWPTKTLRPRSLFREPDPNRSHHSDNFPHKRLKAGLSQP
jgi:hypothetical protein